MSEQIAFIGFEEPYEKELSVYQDILPALQAAATTVGAAADKVEIKHGKDYSSIWYGSILAFRIKLRNKIRYIEVPLSSRDTVGALGSIDAQKETTSGFWRVKLGPEPLREKEDILSAVLVDAINRMPKEWDCCSRYMECSNAKHCVHPSPEFALKCGYRKILESGKIYFGPNRNID